MRTATLAIAALALNILPCRAAIPNRLPADSSAAEPDPPWQQEMADRQRTSDTVTQLLRKPLTVSSAVQIALINNQGIQAAYGETGIAQSEVIQAVTIPNPSVDFDVQFPAVDSSLNRYGWLVAQDFVQLLMAPLKKKVAQAQLETVKLRLADQALVLVRDVKTAFFTCQAGRQSLSLLQRLQETNAAALDLAQKQFQAGNITQFALLQAQSSYSQGRLDVATAEADLRTQREELNRLLSLWGADTDWHIAGELMPIPGSDPSTAALESLAVAQRSDLRAAYRDLDGVLFALGLTRTYRWLPVLDMGFTGERDIDGSLNMGPSFSLQLPIFDQGQSRLLRGQAQLRIAESKLEALAIDIRSQVREYRDKMISLAEAAGFYREELIPTRVRMVNQALVEYNAAQLSQYSLYQIKAQEIETERDYIATLRDYWITRAQLERTVGGTLAPRPAAAQKNTSAKDK